MGQTGANHGPESGGMGSFPVPRVSPGFAWLHTAGGDRNPLCSFLSPRFFRLAPKMTERMNDMEQKIRGLSEAALYKIDSEAKKQGLSRNAYLLNLLERFTALEEFKTYEERYRVLEEQALRAIEDNSALLTQIWTVLNGGDPAYGPETEC